MIYLSLSVGLNSIFQNAIKAMVLSFHFKRVSAAETFNVTIILKFKDMDIIVSFVKPDPRAEKSSLWSFGPISSQISSVDPNISLGEFSSIKVDIANFLQIQICM